MRFNIIYITIIAFFKCINLVHLNETINLNMNLAQYISTLKDITDPLIRKVFKISPRLNLEYLHDTADDIIYIAVKNIDFDEFAILQENNVKLENLGYKLEHFVAEELAKKELKTEYRFSISLD